MKKYIAGVSLFILPLFGVAQYGMHDHQKPILQFGIGAGVLSYMGDLSANQSNTLFSTIRVGYSASLERRFADIIAVSLDGLYGKVAFSEKAMGNSQRRNFETQMMRFGVNAIYHFDNGYIIKSSSPFTPYIGVGVGYTMFTPYSDLRDKNGINYNYWSDGSIMDLPEDDPDASNANRLTRDYNYETQLSTPESGALTFPLTFGLNFKVSDNIHFRFSGTYNLVQSDYLDGFSDDSQNDRFLYTAFSIKYTIRSKDPVEKELKEAINFAAMNKADEDGDGVPDIKDDCPKTPKGVPVDSKGCPLDSDGDGVPDYLDKEPNTPKGALVDSDGVELTEERLLALRQRQDSIAVERTQIIADDPSLSALKKVEKDIEAARKAGNVSTAMPAKFRPVDTNGNGIISATELSAAIDAFFEGELGLTASELNELIDYFFEQ
jgi:opacity protein-like surface antigen